MLAGDACSWAIAIAPLWETGRMPFVANRSCGSITSVGSVSKTSAWYAIWALAGVGRVPLATVLVAVGVAMMVVAGLPLLSLLPRSRLRARSLLRHRSDGLGNLEMELASDGEP